MSNPQKRNGLRVDFSKIPIFVIILAYICYFPVGVILTILRIFGPSVQNKNAPNHQTETFQTPQTEQAYEQINPMPQNAGKYTPKTTTDIPKQKKARKQKKSVLAGVLFVLAALLIFAGVVQTLDDAKYAINFTDFLHNILLNDTLVLYLLGLASGLAGNVLKSRNERQNVIRSVIGSRESINLDKLSSITGVSVKKVRKDLQAMIDKGEFGAEAYIDVTQNVFMRTPHATPNVEKPERTEPDAEEKPPVQEYSNDNFRSIILEIRRLNNEIKDYAVSERIYRIEEHTQNIFDYVTDYPEAMPQIRSFLDYYLPTTLKLLESYRRIEQVGVAGENMKKSKENIENILDMLVVSYKQQVDQLFRHESIDISSEISVLETMIKKDGLDGRVDFDFGGAAAQSMPDEKY